MKTVHLLLLLFSLPLVACGGAGDWAKSGADSGAAEAAHQECRALAGDAVRTDADIDQIFSRRGRATAAPVVRQQNPGHAGADA